MVGTVGKYRSAESTPGPRGQPWDPGGPCAGPQWGSGLQFPLGAVQVCGAGWVSSELLRLFCLQSSGSLRGLKCVLGAFATAEVTAALEK